MTEHYLTLVQLKKVYFNPDVPCLEVIQDGLHPDDAYEYGLLPVLSVMLKCQGPGIYYQQLYPLDQPICLVHFLADAWQNLRQFFTVPNRLIVYPELLESYPLIAALRAIDPAGSIEIIGDRNHSIGSCLRAAQDHATKIEFAPKSEKQIITTADLFESANNYLKPHFHLNWGKPLHQPFGFDSFSDSGQGSYPLNKLDATTLVLPRSFNTPFALSWLTKAALKSQKIKSDQDLYYVGENDGLWAKTMTIAYSQSKYDIDAIYGIGDAFKFKDDPGDMYYLDDMITPGYIWGSEASGLPGGLNAIPYDVKSDLNEIIAPHEFKEFLENRRPMKFTLYVEILTRIIDKPSIFVAHTTKAVKDLVSLICFGSGICSSFELLGDNSDSIPYRLFAIMSENSFSYLLAIPKGSQADNRSITKQLVGEYEVGQLEIGLAGLAALVHFVDQSVELSSSAAGIIGADMMSAMLDSFPEWGF